MCRQSRPGHSRTQVEQKSDRSGRAQKAGKDSKQISYDMFLQGKDIATIAAERELVTSTIETHLTHYVAAGELDVNEIVAKEKIALIQQAVAEHGRDSLGQLKSHLGDDCSYGEIKLVLASL